MINKLETLNNQRRTALYINPMGDSKKKQKK